MTKSGEALDETALLKAAAPGLNAIVLVALKATCMIFDCESFRSLTPKKICRLRSASSPECGFIQDPDFIP
jgi:hypothetical protein